MGKKMFFDPAAEKEATDIGKKFMNSSDVVGDMSRTYGADLSSVRIHTDESAARCTAERGVDAFSTGKDVFFAQGAFDKGDPASRGLLAHELSHSLQQGVGGGDISGMSSMTQSAPMGAEQGGLISWFRNRKEQKRKRQEIKNMELSEPELMDPNAPYTDMDALNDVGDSAPRDFMNYHSYAINQMVQTAVRSNNQQALQSPQLRQMVLEDYNKNMNQRLRNASGGTREEMDTHFRGRSGELHTLNMVLSGFVPENFSDQVMESFSNAQGSNTERTEAAMGYMADTLGGNQELMDYMGALGSSFDGVRYYDGDAEAQSDKMMNNLVLRLVNGDIGKKYGLAQREVANTMKANGVTDQKRIGAEQAKVDKTNVVRAAHLQRAMAAGREKSGANALRLRDLLVKRFRK